MPDTVDSSNNEIILKECLRCGTCCRKHQAILNDEEARKIALFLGISLEKWVKQYADARWGSSRNYLIQHNDSGCVFLENKGNLTSCKIHEVRPACCRDWVPGPDHKECREGLARLAGKDTQE